MFDDEEWQDFCLKAKELPSRWFKRGPFVIGSNEEVELKTARARIDDRYYGDGFTTRLASATKSGRKAVYLEVRYDTPPPVEPLPRRSSDADDC